MDTNNKSQPNQPPAQVKLTSRQRFLKRIDDKLYQRSLHKNPDTLAQRSTVHVAGIFTCKPSLSSVFNNHYSGCHIDPHIQHFRRSCGNDCVDYGMRLGYLAAIYGVPT